MLTDLHVKNLALIDETEVSFGPGLNILTGETGAGKSILLGSVNLALGQKMSRDMIRNPEKDALVELIFQVESPVVRQKLHELDIETEDGQLIITRKIKGTKSVFRINGETSTASRVREAAGLLLDIHGQHEHQKLLYPDNQLEILDDFGGKNLARVKEKTAADYRKYAGIRKELEKYSMDSAERERELSFIEFEIKEIEDAQIQPGEDEELEKKYRRMSNSRQIVEILNKVHGLTDSDQGAGAQTGEAVREMMQAAEYDDGLKSMADSIADVDNLLNDFNREVADYLEDFTFSEEEFYETEKRLDLLNDLKSKYGRTLEDVAACLEEQKAKRDDMRNFDERKAELEKELQEQEKTLAADCRKLTEQRKKAAESLSEEIRQSLKELNFLSSEFEIRFSDTGHYSAKGSDAIEFMISTNPGEPLRPLSKVVSGGELSRIMLAIKTILADKDETETLIFDEIDTGISGRTAQAVSEKMVRIARTPLAGSEVADKREAEEDSGAAADSEASDASDTADGNSGRIERQVICITHLAQIAAMADHHYVIEKHVENGSTVSHIHELSEDQTVEELARILGGAEITPAVLENAREMKQLADKTKSALA
ncbi:MAG: DNA repair protein RecN [Eubacteriales bacterium]|jgi:DNA repair protein RecN (Recombination protein N)